MLYLTAKVRAVEGIVDTCAKTAANGMVKMIIGDKANLLLKVTVHIRITDVAVNLKWQIFNL